MRAWIWRSGRNPLLPDSKSREYIDFEASELVVHIANRMVRSTSNAKARLKQQDASHVVVTGTILAGILKFTNSTRL